MLYVVYQRDGEKRRVGSFLFFLARYSLNGVESEDEDMRVSMG